MSVSGALAGAERFVGRMAGAVAGRRSRAVTMVLWLALAAALSALLPAATAMEAQNPTNLPATAQSVVAGNVQQQAFGNSTDVPGILVFHRPGGLTAQDYQHIHALLQGLAASPLPLQAGAPPLAQVPATALSSLASAGGTGLAVPLLFGSGTAPAELASLLGSLRSRLAQSFGADLIARPADGPGLSARLTGPEGIAVDAAGLFKNADVALLAGTTVLILVLLVLIYRSPILPFVPLLGVGLAYAVTSALLGGLARSGAIVLDAETVSIMTVLMFGAGTDYTLLVVARYRERLYQETDHLLALRQALAGAGGAVMMSAGTVVLTLLALLFAVYGSDHRFAIPFAVGVAMTALAALTFVPALLAVLGRAAFYPDVPAPGKPRPRARGGLLTGIAVRRPAAVAITATVVLLVLASFAPRIRTSYDLLTALPASSQARQGFQLLAQTYGPGSLSPVTVLVEGQGANDNVAAALGGVAGVKSVAGPTFGQAGTQRVAAYQVTLAANPLSNGAMSAVPALRLAARGALVGSPAQVYVAGATAQNLDSAKLVARDTAVVIPIVLVTITLLLILYLRSLVAAGYLIATVVLSFAASIGLGWIVLHYLLGIPNLSGGLVLYAFVFLVALGEDYNIFIMSRIWEERRDRPMPAAVAEGARATGSVITAAGLILAGTFAVLTALPLQILLEFGVVTALGVLVDTFIVRSALVPAITALLQDWALWPRRMPAAVGDPGGPGSGG